MRKVLLVSLAVIIMMFSTRVSGQTSVTNRPFADSAAMLRRAHRRVDSLSLLITKTLDPVPLANLYMGRGIAQGILNHPDSAIHDYSMALLLNSGLREAYPL